ncbi:DNA-binding protein [Polaromonas sp.]|uniref:DNA-binding protein n=1 Tax=Polaromonas sp. TaxID=1869339 RepID=UPI003529F750
MNDSTSQPTSGALAPSPDSDGGDESVVASGARPGRPAPAPHEIRSIEEITAWASAQKASFGRNRRDFNFAVCDALAAAGITPTANMVLKVGHWGTPTSIQADTRDWYQNLGARLRSLESTIPLPARRQANLLLEQLFNIAGETAAQGISDLVVPLQNELTALQTAHAGVQAELENTQLNLSQACNEKNLAEEKLVHLGEAKALLGKELTEIKAKLLEEREARHAEVRALEGKLSEARQALADAKAAHASALLEASNNAESERRRIMLASDAEKVEAGRRLQAVQAELATTKASLEGVRQDLSKTAITAATATASLEGATALLASERNLFAKREIELESEGFRAAALLDFLAQGRKGGFQVSIGKKDRIKGEAWLQSTLGIGPKLAKRLVEYVADTTPLK